MRVVIVGAGIVGVATAFELRARGVSVTVLDRDSGAPRGSTAFAPGFVGVFNEVEALTDLARASVETYRHYTASYSSVGGVELATSDEGAETLARRVQAAMDAGVRATIGSSTALPPFVQDRDVTTVAHYADDGVAEPALLRSEIRDAAAAQGAEFSEHAEAIAIEQHGDGWRVRTAGGGQYDADHVILAGGIWGSGLAGMVDLDLPLFPVAHPYVYARRGEPEVTPGPFVRWPEHHVYARAHNDTLGIGSYDHLPVPVTESELVDGANLSWDTALDRTITSAQRLLRPEARFAPARRINGVFAMTPDNVPFIGPHPAREGIWIAQAIWVTHAGGAAKMLADALLQRGTTKREFAVDRFAGTDPTPLREAAMRLYRDIYANDTVGPG